MKAAGESTTSLGESCGSKKAAKKSNQKVDEKISKVLASQMGRVARPPQKSNRGRKAIDIDEYIRRSHEKIAQWQDQLDKLRKTSAKKDCDTLYNKITALQSRLRRKLEQKQANSTQAMQSSKLQELCAALERHL